MPIYSIAKTLTEEGVDIPAIHNNINMGNKSKGFGKWNPATVKKILQNETYIGSVVQGKTKKINYPSDWNESDTMRILQATEYDIKKAYNHAFKATKSEETLIILANFTALAKLKDIMKKRNLSFLNMLNLVRIYLWMM